MNSQASNSFPLDRLQLRMQLKKNAEIVFLRRLLIARRSQAWFAHIIDKKPTNLEIHLSRTIGGDLRMVLTNGASEQCAFGPLMAVSDEIVLMNLQLRHGLPSLQMKDRTKAIQAKASKKPPRCVV